MKLLSANLLSHVAGGTVDVVVPEIVIIENDGQPAQAGWKSYLPTLKQTLIAAGGFIVGALVVYLAKSGAAAK
jgi:hypothetical protein